MECDAVINKANVTMVFPEACHIVHLFTPRISSLYEDYYRAKGAKLVKRTILTSFESNSNRKVKAFRLKNGNQLSADLVMVEIGIRPNTSLFERQLTRVKSEQKMQSSDSSVYAEGNIAPFPLKLFGEVKRNHSNVKAKLMNFINVINKSQ